MGTGWVLAVVIGVVVIGLWMGFWIINHRRKHLQLPTSNSLPPTPHLQRFTASCGQAIRTLMGYKEEEEEFSYGLHTIIEEEEGMHTIIEQVSSLVSFKCIK